MKRTIFLVDMNAFFVTCEMSRNPELCGKPAAVAGDPQNRTGIILAANYEARRYGIKTTMTVGKARQIVPDLLIVNPDHSFYKQKSNEVMALLGEFSPVIEPNSIDEAWLDLTGCESIYKSNKAAAEIIMEQIKSQLDLACSIGISENKFLAKMASEMKKPMGITELWQSDIQSKMWPLPVSSMYGIGAKTAERLANFGIFTIGDLAITKSDVLTSIIGRNSLVLHQHANGIDNEPVIPREEDDIKSIGRSITLPANITKLNLLRPILIGLVDDVAAAARSHHIKGNIVRLNIKFDNFQVINRQETVLPTNSGNDIFRTAYDLLEKNWQPGWSIRLIGITLAGFENKSFSHQISIFDLVKETETETNTELSAEYIDKTFYSSKLDSVLDKIKEKHGDAAITRASLIKYKNKSFPGIKKVKDEHRKS